MPAQMEVRIASKAYENGVWNVDCAVTTGTTTRMGIHQVELPEDATDEQISQAVLELYA